MPFDPVDYVPPQMPPPRRRSPKLSPRGERVLLIVLAVVVAMLAVLPISAATLVDIVRYIEG